MNDVIDLIGTRKPGVTDLDIKSAEEQLGIEFSEQHKDRFPIKDSKKIKKNLG